MMAAYAMIAAATYQGSGFFTPLYHIASVVISPADMMSSMKSATMGGSNFEFFAGAALLGALIHMMVGAMYGVGFGVLAASPGSAASPSSPPPSSGAASSS